MAFCPRCAAPNLEATVACAACGAPFAQAIALPGFRAASAAPTANTARRGNYALAGLVCAFFFWPAGLVLSIIAYNQIRTRSDSTDGRGVALAGIVISLVMAVFVFIQVSHAFARSAASY